MGDNMIKFTIKHFHTKKEHNEAQTFAIKNELRKFNSLSFQFKLIPEGEYLLEEDFIFSNQYNATNIKTGKSYRVFEYCSCLDDKYCCETSNGYYISKGIEKIRVLQNSQYACGYCGKRYKEHQPFCLACLNSEYLKEKDLYLLRLKKVIETSPKREELTIEEKNVLLPLYLEKQTINANKKIEKQKEKIINNYEQETLSSKIKLEGFKWLLDRNINIDNIIFYNHSNTFCVGWKSRLNDKLLDEWEELLCNFPYKIKFNV